MIGALLQVCGDCKEYQQALFYYWFRGGSFRDSPYFKDRIKAQVHVFGVALDLKLWSRIHYRKPSYRVDLSDNLRNVAIPGTGVRLSCLAQSRVVAWGFYVFVNPVLCFIAALNDSRVAGRLWPSTIAEAFREHLLEPNNWFNYWRINSRLAAWHANVTASDHYAAESKWEFLTWGEKRGVKITPFLKDARIVCKHKNEEGGLGIAFYQNAAAGGDWIIQPALTNDVFLEELLPPNAPLSTFRVITASMGGITGKSGVKVLSCVLRAGRTNADTDHSCVMFNVDTSTGVIGQGLANSHWYQCGLRKALRCPLTPPPSFTNHPDNGKCYVGVKIPNFEVHLKEVIQAHEKLCPEVPLAGWDLALTKEVGPCLLEANLSCNFFKGSFDQKWYLEFIRDYFLFCELTEGDNDFAPDDSFGQRQVSNPQMLVKKTQYGAVEHTALQKQAEKSRQWKRRDPGDTFQKQISVG
jgi:hypothetical protein